MTYELAYAFDEISIILTKLQSRSLLLAKEKESVNALVVTLNNMICVESVHPEERDEDGEIEYVSVGSMRINVDSIKHHNRDQEYAAGEYFNLLGVGNQAVIKEIATFAATLVTDIMGVKAERDENYLPLENEAPPVMP